ncbi:coth-domain-containing protein [Neocallimastix californiae]|jgi:hypothetical protein|uniref:Coth-domain-containing protein n=1 Tax=Neocallimastix californiae TaxID=1754190 RepID=A0A1Y2EWC5_9FUNG|nr:coth-domain-containing protein [Neocallimastix californiae]|eukprot:ORY75860.1 coth-domain-containing protein [Neocallimastix californiae]
MKFNKIVNVLLSCGIAYAIDVNYNVIAFPKEHNGSSVGLVLDGKVIPMTSQFEGSKWNVQAPKPTKSFHFSILDSGNNIVKEESVEREFPLNKDATDNYLYGKLNNNIKNEDIAKVPRAYPALSSESEFSKLFQEGQVKVINIVADPTAISNLHNDPKLAKVGSKSDTTVEMYLIGDDSVKHFTNVTLSFSGMSTRGFAKRPYKVKLSDGLNETKENKSVFGRKQFKLRSLVQDCSYVKQKLVADVGHAMGVYLPQSGFTRLYMNGEPYGLYEITDNPKKNWIKKIIHEDKLPANSKVGSYYKGVSYSDEVFVPASLSVQTDEKWYNELYECENEKEGQEPYTDLKEFINWIATIDNNTSADEIRSKFEVDLFLKYMVIEYLIGHWDGYWIGGNNFYVYKNPETNKYLFMSFDFDLTLGKWDDNPPETPYTEWKQKTKPVSAELVKRVLYHPQFQKQFEEYLKVTVQKTFNIKALGPRLDYFKAFLYDDMAWDKTVPPRAVTSKSDKTVTLEESLNSYEKGACEADYGVKEWITGRSEFVAKQFGVTIPEPDFSLGAVGNKIVKEKDNKKVNADNNSSNLNANDQKSSAITLTSSTLSVIMVIVAYLLM